MVSTTGKKWALVSALTVPPALYLIFVVHFSRNVLWFDYWNVVPLIHAALHGQLSFGDLW